MERVIKNLGIQIGDLSIENAQLRAQIIVLQEMLAKKEEDEKPKKEADKK